MMAEILKIGLVGACGSGKSALVDELRDRGYNARHIAQEHSFAPEMWQRISNPDVLIYLKVSYPQTLKRKSFDWTKAEYDEQIYRMRHAIQHADFEIDTDIHTPEEILEIVLVWIAELSYEK